MLIKNFFSKLLPKSLLSRMILIIVIPALIAQFISAYIFYRKHWDNISKYMVYTLAGEVSFISRAFHKIGDKGIKDVHTYNFLKYEFYPGLKLQHQTSKFLPRELKILKSNLQYNLPNYPINIILLNESGQDIIIEVQIKEGVLSFRVSPKRMLFSSTYVFLLWVFASTFVLLLLTILFAKNQIRSITKLSHFATKASRGGNVARFIPSGAREVRTAGYALLKMRQTLEETVKQKIEMLAGVSHDLKTPITRMQLQLALMNDDKNVSALKEDLVQMNSTINDYLEFARGEEMFSTKFYDIEKLVAKIIPENFDIELQIKGVIRVSVNQSQFLRAVANFINNAQRFASKIIVKIYENSNDVFIEVHDNGPGISEQDMKKVFTPFYRVDNSRNRDSGGIGLGMSISRDIIFRHGGSVTLHKSYLGGLLVIIRLPR
jgi:two-component system osmolarity sensor histidine kinase EnvZ